MVNQNIVKPLELQQYSDCWLSQMKFGNEDDMVIVGVAGQQRVVAFPAIAFCIGDASSDLVQQMVDALPQNLQGYLIMRVQKSCPIKVGCNVL